MSSVPQQRARAAVFAAEVERAPHDANAWHGLARAFFDERNLAAALGATRRAVAENPQLLAAQLTLGCLCERVGYFRDAASAYATACGLAPADAAIRRRLADAQRRAAKPSDALATARIAVALEPESAASHVCLGHALLAVEAEEAADRAFCHALELDPHSAPAECGRGAVALFAARWSSAYAAFERALERDPSSTEARYQRALLDLRLGEYRAGFAAYPAIVHVAEQRPRYHYHASGVPLWDGTPLGVRRLVVAYEQGLGNQIMMARFFERLRRSGRAIAIETPPTLLPLMRRNFPALSFVGFTAWQPLDAMDVHVPLMQLPAALGIGDELDFAMREPYLSADSKRVMELRRRLRLDRRVRHVGIVWHGNRASTRERWRTPPFAAWAPLATVRGVRFHSLQFEATRDELAAFPLRLEPAHEAIHDMEDTAALACLMDVIVSVDTSVAHLGGALARPVWLADSLLSDYRWGFARSDSPWYPSLRIFRQRARDDWRPVFDQIAKALATR